MIDRKSERDREREVNTHHQNCCYSASWVDWLVRQFWGRFFAVALHGRVKLFAELQSGLPYIVFIVSIDILFLLSSYLGFFVYGKHFAVMTLFSTLFEFCTLRCKRGQILSADGTTINITTTTDNTQRTTTSTNTWATPKEACEIHI